LPLIPGTRLGAYEVTAQIGEGGMGQVFRARDTRLDRDVAIKILPKAFAHDADRLARFQREARTLASLNHPNIAAIYGLEERAGVAALVMELVEGEDLSQRIARGAIPLDEALSIAKQIADALDAAHEQGVIHRDLKPANIKVRPDGTVKVLDFGLAKAVDPAGGVPGLSQSPTVTTPAMTHAGTILGTAAYMSPEQARGKTVDKRADIWAFGCILYEMLAGRAAFARSTMPDTIAAVLEREPEWAALPTDTPDRASRLLRRCLDKDARKRARDIGDVRAELEEAAERAAVRDGGVRSRSGTSLRWAAAALLAGAFVAAVWLLWWRTPATVGERSVQFLLSIAEQAAGSVGGAVPTPSPDGRMLTFIAGNSRGTTNVWVRALDSLQARALAGTEGAAGAVAWSPDSRWIAFFADGRLKKISPEGGTAQTVAVIQGFQDAAWGSGGALVYRAMNRAAMYVVPEGGGAARPITKLDASRKENSHRFPQFLPDGRRFLFTARSSERENNALYVASIDSTEVRRLMPAQSRVTYVPGVSGRAGTLLFYQDGALMTQAFDLASMTLQGEPASIFNGISYVTASIQAGFRASSDGGTVIVEQAGASDDLLTWFGRDGAALGTVGPRGDYMQPRISPAGDRVAFTKPDPQNGNRDIWYMDLARETEARLTLNGANDWFPTWSSDGRQILFDSDRDGGERPYLKKSLDLAGEEEPVAGGVTGPWDWSRDGKWILMSGNGAIWLQHLGTGDKPFQFLATPFLESGGRFSPDGKWIAYLSNETGRSEVYVRPFTGAPAGEGRIQISTGGGDFPVWRPDGLELFYMAPDSALYAVSAKNLGALATPVAPVRLFKACPNTLPFDPPETRQPFGWPFDTHDGQRFLVNCLVQPVGLYVVLLNPLAASASTLALPAR